MLNINAILSSMVSENVLFLNLPKRESVQQNEVINVDSYIVLKMHRFAE